ncbi:MAG: GAF domain-containing protein, partial [bacterium]|nr:GAF domain-containing protein [bacterium]
MKLSEYLEEKKKLFAGDPQKAFEDVVNQLKHASLRIAELDKKNRKKIYDLFTLFDIGRDLSSSLEINTIIRSVLLTSRAQMKARNVHLFLKSEADENKLVLISSTSLKSPEERNRVFFLKDHPLVLFLEDKQKPCLLPDILKDMPLNGLSEHLAKLDSLVYVPLIVKETLIGILALDRKIKEEYTEDNLSFLSVLASITAAAVENARLYDHVNQNLNLINGLYQISGIMNSATSLDEILNMVMETITTGFGVEVCAILLLNKMTGKLEVRTHKGLSADTERTYQPEADSVLMEEFKETVFVQDIKGDREFQKYFSSDDKARISYSFAIPLRAGEKLLGSLNIYKFKDFQPTPEKVDEKKNVFSIIASQIAPALLMAKMIEEVREKTDNPFLIVKDLVGREIVRAREFNLGFVLLSIVFRNLPEYFKK